MTENKGLCFPPLYEFSHSGCCHMLHDNYRTISDVIFLFW